MPHVPDTVPGKRVTDAGARTDGCKALPSLSEVGAGCGKAARPVLCGGTGVTRFPTAIDKRHRIPLLFYNSRISANLPVYASQWPLPDTTQDSVHDCWLGFAAIAITGD